MAIAQWAPFTRTSRILHIGDSVTGPFGSPSVSPSLLHYAGLRAAFSTINVPSPTSPFIPAFNRWPKVGDIDGVAGRSCRTIAIDAPTLAAYFATRVGPYTHAVVQLGINDAAAILAASQTLPQVTAAHLAIIDGINTAYGVPYAGILTVGPWQRPADLSVQVPQVVTAFQTNCGLRGSAFVDWSGISSAGVVSIGDQTHPSAAGAIVLAAPLISATIVQAA